MRDIRRDISEFAWNHKNDFENAVVTEENLKNIYNQRSAFRGTIPVEKWMNGSVVGPIAARLYNIVSYIYSEKEGEINRSFIY